MTNPIIRVENLSKAYRIGAKEIVPTGVLGTVKQMIQSPFKYLASTLREPAPEEMIWALKDVSFEVYPGDMVGIIGRNGAGKSTLLKILSRITKPTSGFAEIRGRVASLLEVGTGFHPELTGRENVYLNGTILGMTKGEVDAKFDEIVDFSGVEKFIDTPVKRYSSGMQVRLAFAVAAHLEPEILILDEVLAVGDAQFQKKCLGKMEDVSAKEGKTIVFVSHQMGVLAQLCSKAILLNHGNIVKAGTTDSVIEYYLSQVSGENSSEFTASDNSSNKDIFVTKAYAFNSENSVESTFSHEEDINIGIICKVNRWVEDSIMGFYVRDRRGRKIFTSKNPNWQKEYVLSTKGQLISTVNIPSNFLVPGEYYFTLAITHPQGFSIEWLEDALKVTIIDTGSEYSKYENLDYGCVFANNCKWRDDYVY